MKTLKVLLTLILIVVSLSCNRQSSTPLSQKVVLKDLEKNMVLVEGGSFQMGCVLEQSNCYESEKPVHEVTLGDYYIGKYEVTQAQWELVMGENPSHKKGCANCPVEDVCWNEIQVFIQKLNAQTGKRYRLPTEAEWEYAARGGQKSRGYKYAGSDDIDEVAWYDDNSDDKTYPVGQKQANELGLYDMTGNVWEYCADWYDTDYYSSSPRSNPQGPSIGSERVLRGGSWNFIAKHCTVHHRYFQRPALSFYISGFRLALVP